MNQDAKSKKPEREVDLNATIENILKKSKEGSIVAIDPKELARNIKNEEFILGEARRFNSQVVYKGN